jgi:branched-subunit amino acid permease
MGFIIENLGTIITAAVLVVIVALVIRKMVKDKKQGKSSCGCNCASCPSACACHKK